MVNNYAHLLAAPVTAIFNSSLREGKLPDLWKTATVVPVPKKHPPGSLENDIRPISLTPILAKAFERIVLNWVDDVMYNWRFGGNVPLVVRGYRHARFFRASAPR